MTQNLHVKTWAATGAILWGLYLFVATLFAMKNIEIIGFSNQMFEMTATLYPGLAATTTGMFLGLAYGALCGGICFGLISKVHNKILTAFKKKSG